MNKSAHYEFAEVLQAGENFKISLVLDEYGKQAISKALVDTSDECASARLHAQAEFLKDAKHPSIVNFRDNTNGDLFMEAMAGDVQTLAMNSKKRLSSGETASFLRQMLTLLSHLNSRGLTVGQLSPRAILGNEDLTVFKIAKAYKKDSPIPADPAEIIFPPEINSAEDYDVNASDIYCLGMTCVELALGRAGFESLFKGMYDNSCDLWIRWHENEHETLPELAEILDGFPKVLTDILQKMIEKPLHLRYNSADEVLSELNKIGIVDEKATVKKKATWQPVAKIVGCAALALFGAALWMTPPAPEEVPAPKPQVTQAPVSFDISVSSNRPFKYKIVGNNNFGQPLPNNGSQSISLQEDEQLMILKPSQSQEGWNLSINKKEEQSFDGVQEFLVADLSQNPNLNLRFSRSFRFDSNCHKFVYKLDESSINGTQFNDSPLFQITNTDQQKHVWVKPDDSTLKFAGDTPDANGWFKKEIPQNRNAIKIKFMVPVELELAGHQSVSDCMAELDVRVDFKKMKFEENRFVGEIAYSRHTEFEWNVAVAYNGNELFSKSWNQIPSTSEINKRIELKGNVHFDLPPDFMLQEVNGKTDFNADENDVSVPFGKSLEFVITDRSGVIQFRERVNWTKEIKISADENLLPKRLRNQGNKATYWLVREADPSAKKEIGVTGKTALLPSKNQNDYLVIVEWSTNLKREFPLKQFLATRNSLELWPAAVDNQTAPVVSTSQDHAVAIK